MNLTSDFIFLIPTLCFFQAVQMGDPSWGDFFCDPDAQGDRLGGRRNLFSFLEQQKQKRERRWGAQEKIKSRRKRHSEESCISTSSRLLHVASSNTYCMRRKRTSWQQCTLKKHRD